MALYRSSWCPYCKTKIESGVITGINDYESEFGPATLRCPKCKKVFRTGRDSWDNMGSVQRARVAAKVGLSIIVFAVVLGGVGGGGLAAAMGLEGNSVLGFAVAGILIGTVVGGMLQTLRFRQLASESSRDDHEAVGRRPTSSTDEATDALAQAAIADPDPKVRATAQEGIKQRFPGGAEAFDGMMERFIKSYLTDPDERTRGVAAGMIVTFGEMALPRVKQLLKHPDPFVRQRAVALLSRMSQATNAGGAGRKRRG